MSLIFLILDKSTHLLGSYFISVVLMGVSTFFFYFLYQSIIGDDYLRSVWLLDHSDFGITFLGVLIPLTEVIFGAFVAPYYLLLLFLLEPQLKFIKDSRSK